MVTGREMARPVWRTIVVGGIRVTPGLQDG